MTGNSMRSSGISSCKSSFIGMTKAIKQSFGTTIGNLQFAIEEFEEKHTTNEKPLHLCSNIDNYTMIPKTFLSEIVTEIK